LATDSHRTYPWVTLFSPYRYAEVPLPVTQKEAVIAALDYHPLAFPNGHKVHMLEATA
jgi:hypothetical protein